MHNTENGPANKCEKCKQGNSLIKSLKHYLLVYYWWLKDTLASQKIQEAVVSVLVDLVAMTTQMAVSQMIEVISIVIVMVTLPNAPVVEFAE